MKIRFIASEIRTGTVANGFGGCPAFLFCPLSLTRGNEVYHLTESCWPRRFVPSDYKVVHCITAEHCGRCDKGRPALSKISHLIFRIRKEHRTSCYARV